MYRRRTVSGAISALVTIAVAIGGLSAGSAAAATSYRADGNLSDWHGDPTMLSGQTRVSKGELIYDDWLYDDYGADLDHGPNQPEFRGNLAPTTGDYRYPTNDGRYGYNAADLRELRVAADAYGLHLLVYLQTMKERNAAIFTLGIDSDRDSGDTDQWPDGAGVDAPKADHFITSWGTGGFVTDGRGKRVRIRRQAVNLAENAIEVDVPWHDLGNLRNRAASLYLVTGLADPANRRYLQPQAGQATATVPGGGLPGSTAVFDVAFDPNEVFTRFLSHWGEEVQSEDLANRSVSGLGQRVDLSELEAGRSDSYVPATGRFYNRIFRSHQDYGEGISLKQNPSAPGGDPSPQFRSPYQPYGLYIPAGYSPANAAPLLINGHSLDVNQNEYQAVSPNLYKQLGDDRLSFVITPLARGMDTWYIESGFEDVLEAWDDLKAHYTIDDETTSIGGYSMGGYMTYRMGLLMPDKFAAAAAYVGPPAYQLWFPPSPPQPSSAYQVAGQTNNIITNALNLPFEINDTGEDELVPVAGANQQAQTFTDLGRAHDYFFYPAGDHFALIAGDDWTHTAGFLDRYPQRDLTPIEVAYRRYPSMDLPQLGHRFDGAYWTDGMVVRTPTDTCAAGTSSCQSSFGQVDATTYGFGGNRSVPVNYQWAYPGPPLPANVTGTSRVPGPAIPQQNGFEATFQNLQAITFDTTHMGLNPSQQLTASLTMSGSGGAFTLRLDGSFGAVSATLDSAPVPVTHTANGIELALTLNTGQHQLVISP
jgi:dienelactone hydrolase